MQKQMIDHEFLQNHAVYQRVLDGSGHSVGPIFDGGLALNILGLGQAVPNDGKGNA